MNEQALLYPLLFEPNLHTVVWGGGQLRPYKGLEPSDEPIGESWEVSAVPTSTSIVSNGVWQGRDLVSVIHGQPEAILGKKVNEKYHGQLPLLVKFIDAQKDLSIQVHPNDEMAMREHGKMGKSEMWYVIMGRWASRRCGMSSRLMRVPISMQDSNGRFKWENTTGVLLTGRSRRCWLTIR